MKDLTNNNDITEIICILDRSGSMATIWDDAVGGIKTLIKDQKKDAINTTFTLVAFDDQYEEKVSSVDIQKFEDSALNKFGPRGSTALLDAIGKTINNANSRWKDNPPSKVMYCIVTDGHENASREFKYKDIKKLIAAEGEKGREFVYLGANQDAFEVGSNLGLSDAQCANFDANSRGIRAVYSATSGRLRSYRNDEQLGSTQSSVDLEYNKLKNN